MLFFIRRFVDDLLTLLLKSFHKIIWEFCSTKECFLFGVSAVRVFRMIISSTFKPPVRRFSTLTSSCKLHDCFFLFFLFISTSYSSSLSPHPILPLYLHILFFLFLCSSFLNHEYGDFTMLMSYPLVCCQIWNLYNFSIALSSGWLKPSARKFQCRWKGLDWLSVLAIVLHSRRKVLEYSYHMLHIS
jgi:hypothetical protein